MAPEFIHTAVRSGHPSGVTHPNVDRVARSSALFRLSCPQPHRERAGRSPRARMASSLWRERRRVKKIAAGHNRANDLCDVAVSAHERGSSAVDQRGGRLVTHQSSRRLEGDVMRRRRMTSQNVEHFLAVIDSTSGAQRVPEDCLGRGVVQVAAKHKHARVGRRGDRPSRQRAQRSPRAMRCMPSIDISRW